MKKKLFLSIILFSNFCFAQIKFEVEYEADYKLTYKLYNTKDSPIKEAAFALLIGNNKSYFKNMNKYVGDSLIVERRLKKTGDLMKDVTKFSPYYTVFPENIGMTSSKIFVSLEISDKQFKYEEENDIKWEVKNEFKKIGTMNCQKAETYRYGRKWIAYFNENIPFQFGPYKFGNLPGLIVELFDEDKNYLYSMYNFKKRKYICKSANLYTKAILVNKEKVFNYKARNFENMDRFNGIIDDPETLKELREKSKEMAKKYNPIELKIK